jgi:hypothetical protein
MLQTPKDVSSEEKDFLKLLAQYIFLSCKTSKENIISTPGALLSSSEKEGSVMSTKKRA